MRSAILATVLALATLVSIPAFAGTSPSAGQSQRAEGGKGKRFPMAAAEFKSKVDGRLAKARTRMEERAAKLPADQAKELRAKFDATSQKVAAEVAKAVADGTVTKDEARAVRAASPHHRRHERHGKGAPAKS